MVRSLFFLIACASVSALAKWPKQCQRQRSAGQEAQRGLHPESQRSSTSSSISNTRGSTSKRSSSSSSSRRSRKAPVANRRASSKTISESAFRGLTNSFQTNLAVETSSNSTQKEDVDGRSQRAFQVLMTIRVMTAAKLFARKWHDQNVGNCTNGTRSKPWPLLHILKQ